MLATTLLSLLPLAAPQDAEDLATIVSRQVARYDSETEPGVAVGVIRSGELVFADGFGLASLEHGVPISADTVFRIASVSKQFTACCVAMLALEGRVDLEADVRTYFPEMRAYPTPIRVRDLVHHTSGIRDYPTLHSLAGEDPEDHVSPEESFAAIFRQRSLCFEPRSRYRYSNSNDLLLGELVRRVSGQSLGAFADERIFEPLGMTSTSYQEEATRVVRNRAWGYAPSGDAFVLSITSWDHVGDGSVFTTVRDLARWDAFLERGHLPSGEELLGLMHSTEPLADGTPGDYAFGLALGDYRGVRSVQHSGGWVGFRTMLMRFPDQRLTLVCLANRADGDPGAVCRGIADELLVFPEREEPEAVADEARPGASSGEPGEGEDAPRPEPLTPEGASELLGSYWSPELETHVRVVWERGRMRLDGFGRGSRRATPLGPDAFRVTGGELRFTRDEAGAIDGLVFETRALGPFPCERAR